MRQPTFYFDWLQKDNPTGKPDRLPELRNTFETTVPGIYCVGDLTGIPLIKLAAESGYELIERLARDEQFRNQKRKQPGSDIKDLIIIGGGPAGVSACLHAAELGFSHVVLESTRLFSTIENFPTGKPIYVTPQEPPMKSVLTFSDGTKESLLEELHEDIRDKDLPIVVGEEAKRIIGEDGYFTVVTADKKEYKALRVIVAIGKSGNPRMLKVPGEDLPKVFSRLIDPAEFENQNVLVVGGGDSAVEAAVALAKKGAEVWFSYRKDSLSRPKEQNIAAFNTQVERGTIHPYFESRVKEIRPEEVVLQAKGGDVTLPNQVVFTLLGTELPISFFKRSDIRIEGERHFPDWIKIAGLILFASLLYFGKKAPSLDIDGFAGFFTVPGELIKMPWARMTNGLAAWMSLPLFILTIIYLVGHFIKYRTQYFTSSWNYFKYAFYFSMAALFIYLYMAYKLFNSRPIFSDMGDWYTTFYSLTIMVFGFRRIAVNPTGYIKRQTWLLMAFQVIPLFILPLFVLPFMADNGMIGQWVSENVFPNGAYWRAYGLILAWPLFIHNLAMGEPTVFWLWAGLAQTFLIIPAIVYAWGKGAYCGWVCSCGALAETLGDEYRTTAPHGPRAKRMDNVGQYVLWFAGIVTILAWMAGNEDAIYSRVASDIYAIVVDIVFAGVLGVGVYFFMSGRFWCRFLCPLAALMHIYARFSPYRIFANKKRCISCNICTKVCHMGIDVMSYANKGIPMNDVECVRCSACVVNCPMQVLTFGSVGRPDPDNVVYKKKHVPLTKGWASGLPRKDIEMLVREEQEKK